MAATCIGCGLKQSWNGKPNEYCTRSCRRQSLSPPTCAIPRCRQPVFADANGPSQYCRTCLDILAPLCPPGPWRPRRLDKNEEKYLQLEKQCWDKWSDNTGFPRPCIKEIWDVTNPQLEKRFNEYIKKLGMFHPYGHGSPLGNVQRRMHGCQIACKFQGAPCGQSGCGACGVMSQGFNTKLARRCFFGKGGYFTSSFSTACKYAKGLGSQKITGAVLICRVACGRPEMVDGNELTQKNQYENADRPEDGSHSRIVNNPQAAISYTLLEQAHGRALLKTEDEIIVFDDGAILPRHLILFS